MGPQAPGARPPVVRRPEPAEEQRPEILGIDDGLRTCVFYAMDDISCPWQTKAFAVEASTSSSGASTSSRTPRTTSPLRARLDRRRRPKSDRYASAVKGGAKARPAPGAPEDRRRLDRQPQLQGPGRAWPPRSPSGPASPSRSTRAAPTPRPSATRTRPTWSGSKEVNWPAGRAAGPQGVPGQGRVPVGRGRVRGPAPSTGRSGNWPTSWAGN